MFSANQTQTSVCTMEDIIGRILDYTVCPSSDHSTRSGIALEENLVHSADVAGSSKYFGTNELQSELNGVENDYQRYM